jgi:C-terminal processing protease CtpA/Prc
MKTRILVLLSACLIAGGSIAPAVHAQSEMRSSRAGQRSSTLGFAYSGAPDFSTVPARWADYPVVRHVYETSPAQYAGLAVGDVILKVNGRDGCETTAYHHFKAGDRLTLLIQRGREQKEISFELTEPNWPDRDWAPTFTSQ